MGRKIQGLLKVAPQFKEVGDKLYSISKEYCDKWGYALDYECTLRNPNKHFSLDPIEAILYYLKSDLDFEWLYQAGTEGVCTNHTISLDDVLNTNINENTNMLTMYNNIIPLNKPLPFFTNLKESNYGIEFLNKEKSVIVNSLFIKKCDWSITLFENLINDTRLEVGVISMLPPTSDRFEIGLQNYYDAYQTLHNQWISIPLTEWMSYPKIDKEIYKSLDNNMKMVSPEHKIYNPNAWVSIISCTSVGETNADTLLRIADLEESFIKS